MMNDVDAHDCALPAGADVDATVVRRMTGRRREPYRVVQLKIVLDQKRLARRNHRLAIETPHIAVRVLAPAGRLFPCCVFALVKHVFRFRESRHPSHIAKRCVPSAVVEVWLGTEDVINVLETNPGRVEAVEPWLFGEIEWRWIALVLPRTGIDQNRMPGGAHDYVLIGDDQSP